MSTKDKDEPFVTGEGNASTLPERTRVGSSDVPASISASRSAHVSEGDEGGSSRGGHGRAEARTGLFERTGDFVNATRAEMHRVSWPSATEVKNTTIITIIAVLFFAAYLFLVDRGWTLLIEGLTSLLGRVA